MQAAFYACIFSGGVLGAVMGSFFSATVWAWLQKRKNPPGRSICDHCGQSLSALSLIPIFSFMFLKGKCRHCGGKIPLFHFYVEILSAALGALIVFRLGLGLPAYCYIVLAAALCAASAADILTRRLPDFISLGALALLPILLLTNCGLTLKDAIIGYITGGGMPLLLLLAFKFLRHKEALGMGDVKLFALAGAFLGPLAIPPLFLLASLGGIMALFIISISTHKALWSFRLPFGPFISAGFLLLLLFPSLLKDFYTLLPPAF